MGNDDVRELAGVGASPLVNKCPMCKHDLWIQTRLGGGEDEACYRCHYTMPGSRP
jgi:hypothetical protein